MENTYIKVQLHKLSLMLKYLYIDKLLNEKYSNSATYKENRKFIIPRIRNIRLLIDTLESQVRKEIE